MANSQLWQTLNYHKLSIITNSQLFQTQIWQTLKYGKLKYGKLSNEANPQIWQTLKYGKLSNMANSTRQTQIKQTLK